MTETIITKTIILAASRSTVWDFLTKADRLAEWFHRAENDLEVGQNYALFAQRQDGSRTPQCWGTVLEMEPPTRLVYSFTVKPLSEVMTTVTWTLEDVFGGTRLSLVHEGIAEAAGDGAPGLLLALDAGWDQHLAGLRTQSVKRTTMETA